MTWKVRVNSRVRESQPCSEAVSAFPGCVGSESRI